jgi:hypothetical protein
MSRDKYEDIVVRIEQILTTLAAAEEETTHVWRDRIAFDENDDLPAYLVLDGSEERKMATTDKQGFNIMEVTPPIFYIPKPTENHLNLGVGPKISARRTAIIKAIKSDGELQQICGANGYIEYIRTQTDMDVGLEVEGHIRVEFAFGYALNFSKL